MPPPRQFTAAAIVQPRSSSHVRTSCEPGRITGSGSGSGKEVVGVKSQQGFIYSTQILYLSRTIIIQYDRAIKDRSRRRFRGEEDCDRRVCHRRLRGRSPRLPPLAGSVVTLVVTTNTIRANKGLLPVAVLGEAHSRKKNLVYINNVSKLN